MNMKNIKTNCVQVCRVWPRTVLQHGWNGSAVSEARMLCRPRRPLRTAFWTVPCRC